MTPNEERRAILRGMRVAEKVHRDLGSRSAEGNGRVDVFRTIVRSGAALMFQPLDPLLGAFAKENGVAGILITTRRPLGMQRFTAAHELGHLVLGHDPQADDDKILRRAPVVGGAKFVPREEREADAFASAFLLPKWLIATEMHRQGWTKFDLTNAAVVYQASLRFGASYSATVFALERENLITRTTRLRLLEVKPRQLKTALVPDFAPESWQRVDVWQLTERDEGTIVEASRDDLFLLRLRENGGSGYLWNFDELEAAGFVILRDGREPITPGAIGAPVVRRVLGQPRGIAAGTYRLLECRPWDPDDHPRTLTLHCSTATSYEKGLWQPERERLLQAS